MAKLTILALLLSGCSLIAVRDPADIPPGQPMLCDPRPVLPVTADGTGAALVAIVAGAAGISAIHDDHNAALGVPILAAGAAVAAALGYSSAIGYRRGADCRALMK